MLANSSTDQWDTVQHKPFVVEHFQEHADNNAEMLSLDLTFEELMLAAECLAELTASVWTGEE